MQPLVERHIINEGHSYFDELDDLCFKSKNLYNVTLYCMRQSFIFQHRYPNYYELNPKFSKRNKDVYRALPAKVSKMVMMLVDKNMRSYFALRKMKKNGEYDKKVRLPNYLDSIKGRQIVHYEKQAISFKKKTGYIHLSKTKIFVKSKIAEDDVQFVRIVPKGNHFVIEVGYHVETKEPEYKYNRMVSGDMGLNNLLVLSSNVIEPLIINGKPVKSINQRYNKEIAKYKRKLPKGIYTSKRIKNLYKRRKNKIMDYLHKASSKLVSYLVFNRIDTLVIGRNKGWKQNIKLGKKNNQNFVGVPFHTFIQLLRYKCNIEGIHFETQEEAYTSKCSFFDNESIKKHKTYLGKRVKRGLFETAMNKKVNADLNGSLNILKKHCQKNEVWNNQLWLDCIEVSSTPNLQKLTI